MNLVTALGFYSMLISLEVQLGELDCLKDLDFFKTMCKILMELKKKWSRRRLMS